MNGTLTLQTKSSIPVYVSKAGEGEYYFVVTVRERTDPFHAAMTAYRSIADSLDALGAQIVHERVFGNLSVERDVRTARTYALSDRNIPVQGALTYVEGAPPWGKGFSGLILHAICPTNPDDVVWALFDGNRPAGRLWKQNGNSFIVLQNINGLIDAPNKLNTPALQATRMFERAQTFLHEHGCGFQNVVRTWIHLSDILSWYEGFNHVRNAAYKKFDILPSNGKKRFLLPASSAIGATHPQGFACTMDILAVANSHDVTRSIRQITNPGQINAYRYGSAFSRGSAFSTATTKIIQVSGTSAIDKKGEILYKGDIQGQINTTLDKLESLLKQEKATFSDFVAATVFVKRPQYAQSFYELASERNLESFPAVCLVADMCREDILFEIDGEVAV